MSLSWIPNAITIARILSVGPLVWLICAGHYTAAFWLMIITGASDALDGALAKGLNWQSRLGGIIDPIADKLLLASSIFALYWIEAIPFWLMAIVLLRDIVILCGAYAWWRLVKEFKAVPSYLGKFTTFFQIVLVIAVMLPLAGYFDLGVYLPWVQMVVAGLCLLSGADYVLRYTAKAQRLRMNAREKANG